LGELSDWDLPRFGSLLLFVLSPLVSEGLNANKTKSIPPVDPEM